MPLAVKFITGNANKLKEVAAILGSGANAGSFELSSQDVPGDEIQGTTRDVATHKVNTAAKAVGGACITEDTALGFEALNGLPGPYIKDFMKSVGHQGLNAMLAGFDSKAATAICTFAYSPGPGQEPLLFEGKTAGRIVPARGPTHFGWDAIFQPDGFEETYAEMDPITKNKISHRYKALDLLKTYLLDEAAKKA